VVEWLLIDWIYPVLWRIAGFNKLRLSVKTLFFAFAEVERLRHSACSTVDVAHLKL
jgi:hypothetical protein